jgi:uncharacterized RDD family membrane protein YckC
MSNMPERDIPGQYGNARQNSPGGHDLSQHWGTSLAGWETPVHQDETRVTGRRVIQYWVDAFLVSIVPYLVSIPFDRSGRTLLHVLGGLVYVVLFSLIGLWYWVIRPHHHSGQTFAMKWLSLRTISKNGGPASMVQLFVRWISLLIDSAPWFWPFTGLVGLIIMLCSKYRQRVGDHLARTLVVATTFGVGGRRQFSGTGGSQAGAIGGGDQEQMPAGSRAGQPGAGQWSGAGQPGGSQQVRDDLR